MIRRASTAALGYSSGALSLGKRSAPPGWRPETEDQQEVLMNCRFVTWVVYSLTEGYFGREGTPA